MRFDLKQMYDVQITPAVGGMVVRVGCHTRVYPDTHGGRTELAGDLVEYLADPVGTQKLFNQYNESLNPHRNAHGEMQAPEVAGWGDGANTGFEIPPQPTEGGGP